MNNAQERAIFTDAATSSAGQFGSGAQRRQAALEMYVAAVADRGRSHRKWAAPDVSGTAARTGTGDTVSQGDAGPRSGPEATVATVMNADIFSVGAAASFGEVLEALADHRDTACAVVGGNGMVIGVVSEADLLAGAVRFDRREGPPLTGPGANPVENPLTAGDLMSSPAITVTADASITDAATIAAEGHVKRLPVVDRGGRLIGSITRGDLLAAYVRHLDRKSSDDPTRR